MKFTFCIPSKNNLRYLKNSIRSIKQNSSFEHDIIVYVDADNDGTVEWLRSENVTYLLNETDTPKGIAYGYNRCIEQAQTDVVCMFHADMFLGKGFDTNLLKHLKPKTVVSATRIEPPLHPSGLEKIVENFGMYPEDFLEEEFNSFVEKMKVQEKDRITNGIFAPWLAYRQELLEIGMHDEIFHSYHEDSDIFNRMLLNGSTFVQSRDAFVYHLTCRGGQFQDGIEQVTSDEKFHSMKYNAMRHYIRKWGSWIKNNEYQHPIIPPKYDVGIVLEAGLIYVENLEPWCSKIYLNDPYQLIIPEYIKHFQKETAYDLTQRVVNLAHNKVGSHDIILYIRDFNQQDFANLQMLSEIIQSTNETGMFELGNMRILITDRNELQNDLIYLKPPPYHN